MMNFTPKALLLALAVAGTFTAFAQDSSTSANDAASTKAQSSASQAKSTPEFSGTDTSGKTYSSADLKGKVVVLEWTNPDCPFVQRHYKSGTMDKLAQKYKDKGVVWLAVFTSGNASKDKVAGFIEKNKVSHPVLIDADGKIGKAFEAKTTPHMFVIDKEGNIAYDGAIDDDPAGDKDNPRNYVDEAVAKLLAGQHPEVTTTQSYGCGVKYAQK